MEKVHSRCSVMDFFLQIHTGLQHWVIQPPRPYGLPLDDQTLADRLRSLGYATHIVGKWHLGYYKKEYMPTYRGFDSHFGEFSSGLWLRPPTRTFTTDEAVMYTCQGIQVFLPEQNSIKHLTCTCFFVTVNLSWA